jgi:hypothetical protein
MPRPALPKKDGWEFAILLGGGVELGELKARFELDISCATAEAPVSMARKVIEQMRRLVQYMHLVQISRLARLEKQSLQFPQP